ncbi:hypothetical protein KQX54_020309 [Cotesia glomerata]|uniref:Gustatory receptor n=1 Tax=Cotesia glomerata TaxID=32391 RepID=A0AAV7IRN8_COTGL|nr:hypothetical protein KQX54_020309 [Cotesia glomerata]
MNSRKFSQSKLTSMFFIAAFFKIFGLAPFRVSFLRKRYLGKPKISFHHSWKGTIYNFVLLLPMVVELVSLIVKFSVYLQKEFLALWISLAILWVTPVILLYFCFNQRKSIEILGKLVEIEYDLTDSFNRSVSRKHKNLNYEISLFIPQILFSVIHTTHIIVKLRSYGLFVIITSGFMINNLILLYALLINFITKRYDFINEMLLTSIFRDKKTDLTFLTSSSQNEMTLKTLILIRKQQRKLYQVCKDVSNFFSWPILLAVVLFCVRLIFYSFIFAKRMFICSSEIDLMTLISEPATLAKEIFVILVLAHHMSQFTFEIQKTGEIIYKIMDVYSMHGGIQSELEQFSVEIMHRRIPNSVFGLFTIDGSLVTSIARSTFTYLVILIQFTDQIFECLY